MLVVAIDNSIGPLTIAVAEGGRLLAERNIADSRSPSEIIASAVGGTLADCRRTINDVEALFVTIGPGSFTGIRVSLAFCKGLTAALQIPVIGVPTLDVLAQPLSHLEGYYLCPLIDARKGEVFLALYYVSKGELTRLTDYRAVKPETVPEVIKTPCLCFGTGAALCEGVLTATKDVKIEKDAYSHVSAEALIKTGLLIMARSPRSNAEPIYGRRSEAEIRFNVMLD